MSRMKRVVQALFVATPLAVPCSPLVAQVPETSSSVTVNCSASGRSLQDALNTAPPGASVAVTGRCAGGPYLINKDVKLSGYGEAILSTASGSNHVLQLRGVKTDIAGLTVDATGANSGIIVDGSRAYISNIVVENASGAGIVVGGSGFASVHGSTVRNNGIGIFVVDSSSLGVGSSTIEQNLNFGIFVYKVSSAFIVNSAIRNGNGVGVAIDHLSHATLDSSVVQANAGNGVRVGQLYATLTLNAAVNTLQNNSPDVSCGDRGVIEVAAPQNSATKTTSIAPSIMTSQLGCSVVGGPIFAP